MPTLSTSGLPTDLLIYKIDRSVGNPDVDRVGIGIAYGSVDFVNERGVQLRLSDIDPAENDSQRKKSIHDHRFIGDRCPIHLNARDFLMRLGVPRVNGGMYCHG